MKKIFFSGLIMMTVLSFNTFAQENDSTGMPGDNFDLQAALDLFKQSKNLQDFEKKLNTESNGVNNLDLDGNNTIDYIRVVDKKDGNNHAILLQVPVNKTESQDIAAIVIEKRTSNEAQLQIIGNETLYGEEKIMEPVDEKEIKKSSGPAILAPTTFVFVNVWGWPCVQYIYDPFYDPWFSPYYWNYYPSWWNPWRPVYWHVYYQRVYRYHGWCHYTTVYHVPHAHALYANHHSNSSYVKTRYASQQAAYKARSVNNQSANGSKGRIGTGKSETVVGRNSGSKVETARPTTNSEQKTLRGERVTPRPINSNNRGNVTNGNVGTNRNSNGTIRTAEPSRRNPTTAPQQRPVERAPQRVEPQPRRPVERSPQRIQPQPQRQTQPVRQAPVNRPVIRPGNGGGRR